MERHHKLRFWCAGAVFGMGFVALVMTLVYGPYDDKTITGACIFLGFGIFVSIVTFVAPIPEKKVSAEEPVKSP